MTHSSINRRTSIDAFHELYQVKTDIPVYHYRAGAGPEPDAKF